MLQLLDKPSPGCPCTHLQFASRLPSYFIKTPLLQPWQSTLLPPPYSCFSRHSSGHFSLSSHLPFPFPATLNSCYLSSLVKAPPGLLPIIVPSPLPYQRSTLFQLCQMFRLSPAFLHFSKKSKGVSCLVWVQLPVGIGSLRAHGP